MPTVLQRITYTLKRRWVRQTSRRDQQIKIRSCQYHPHKHVLPSLLIPAAVSDFKLGYPNLATFKSSSEAFSVYRRFGYLQSRLLLEKQDVLRVLEQRLDQYDREHVTTSYTRTLNADELMPRQALLEEIEHAFNSYGWSQRRRGRARSQGTYELIVEPSYCPQIVPAAAGNQPPNGPRVPQCSDLHLEQQPTA